MKNPLPRQSLVILASFAVATLFPGCAARKNTDHHATTPVTAVTNTDQKARFITTAEMTAMTPRTATFTKRLSEYSGSFRTVDGKELVLGDPAGDQWVWHFLATLNEGESCRLPEAFLNYRSAPYYVSIQEIAAMTPRTGTLATRTPCSAYFKTADGKGFGIGNPGSGPQISRFIWTLKRGESYKFPDAFLAYQQQKPPTEE